MSPPEARLSRIIDKTSCANCFQWYACLAMCPVGSQLLRMFIIAWRKEKTSVVVLLFDGFWSVVYEDNAYLFLR